MTTLLEKYIAKVEKKKYTFHDVNWGGGIVSKEPVEDTSISLAHAQGFNKGLSDIQSLLPELIKEVEEDVVEKAELIVRTMGQGEVAPLLQALASLKEPNIK